MRGRRKDVAATLLLPLLFAAVANAEVSNDFSAYPINSQACLYKAADASGCTGDTVQQLNTCLCGNGGNFVLATAGCVAASDPGDLEGVYSTMTEACSFSSTPLEVSQAQFFAAASAASSSAAPTQTTSTSTTSTETTSTTTGQPTTTTFSSSTPSVSVVTSVVSGQTVTVTESSPGSTGTSGAGNGDSGGNNNNNGSSKIGIIAGAAAGGAVGLALIAAAVFFILRHRRRKAAAGREEAHPMLPPKYGPYGGDFSMQPTTGELPGNHAAGPPGQVEEWKAHSMSQGWQPTAANQTPGPTFSWETPYNSQWGNTPTPQPQVRPQSFQGPGPQGQSPLSAQDQMNRQSLQYLQQQPQQQQPQQQQLQQQQQPQQQQQAWGYTPPVPAATGGYAQQQPSLFELAGAETQIPGQPPAEVASTPIHPPGGGQYPGWGR